MLSGKDVNWNFTLTPELLDQAAREDKLIFLHIGYISNIVVREGSSQLFSNKEVTKLLNENFISIAEDRDDNPESFLVALDMLFMNQDFSYGPMNLFIMPDRRPIVCFSETDPETFISIAEKIIDAKKNKRELLDKLADELSRQTRNSGIISGISPSVPATESLLHDYIKSWFSRMFHSDFLSKLSPYTPNPSSLYTVVEYLREFPDKEMGETIESFLEDLQFSPLFDPIDGGFYRQAKDYTCAEPLFEKNLEDNSQYIILYSAAYSLFGKESFRETVYHIYSFINKEFASPSGGYYSNATLTDNIESAVYYSCSINEIEHLFPVRYPEIAVALGMDTRLDPSLRQNPVRNPDTYSSIRRDELETLQERRKEHRSYLVDKRIITSYNAQLAKALSIASRVLKDNFLQEEATAVFDFLINNNINAKGKLLRYTCCSNGCRFGFLSDYAYLIDSSVELYKTSGSREFRELAIKYMSVVMENFYKPENGMFSKSEKGAAVPVVPFKRESNIDLIKPSANSVMAGNLIELYRITQNKTYLETAGRQLSNIASDLPESGPLLSSWAHKLLLYVLLSEKN